MNSIVRLQNPGPNVPAPGTRQGDWVWDGNQWMCSPCGSGDAPPFPCPPPGFPPAGCPPWFSGVNSPPWYPGANAGVSFGTTAPSNPVRGHFWWNGLSLFMFDGAAWVQIGGAGGGGGTATGPIPPANPFNGQLWFNGSVLFVWDGEEWVPQAGTVVYTQPTAPPAPNPGDQWWDGTQMRIWDGDTWNLVGPGQFVGPVGTTTIVFALAQTTGLSLGGAAWAIIPWSATPLVDTQIAYDPVTKKITPKKAGMYQFGIRGITGGSGGGGAAIVKNDTGTFAGGAAGDIIVTIVSNSASSSWFASDGMVQMNGSTDFVRAWSTEAAGNWIATGANPCFSGVLLP